MATPKPPNFWQRIQNFLTDKNRVGIRRGQPPDAAPTPEGGHEKPLGPGPKPREPQRGEGPQRNRLRPSTYMGDVSQEPGGPIEPPDVGKLADVAIPDLQRAETTEVTKARKELSETEQAAAGREGKTERDIARGIRGADAAQEEIGGIAEAGKVTAEELPGKVKADIEGITDEFKATTDVDIGKIESLGREAVGMALDGKNAAAQAAVEAQQGSVRNAIAQITADTSIPQSRKTAMIAQIQMQGSMQIAATVGTNIKDFTAMQTNAMTATMQSVGSAMQSRDAILGQLGGAEINAVASAHETAAGLMKGYDDMAAGAIQSAEQLKYQYNTLAQTARDSNNANDLQLLGQEFYVGGMPVDFKMTNLQLLRDMQQSDFAMQLQSRGYKTMEEAIAKGDQWAKQTMLYQMLAPFLPGPVAMIGSFMGGSLMGGGQGGGGQA